MKKNYLLQVILLLVLATALDRLKGPEIKSEAFYIFPITLASWRMGKNFGYACSLIAVVTKLIMGVELGDAFLGSYRGFEFVFTSGRLFDGLLAQ